MRTTTSRFLLILLTTLLLVPFQNCSKAKFNSNNQSGGAEVLSQNGTGYGGKVYVSRLLWDNFCSDGTQIRGRFTSIDASSAIMDRRNCVDVPDLLIDLTAPGTISHYSTNALNPFDLYVHRERLFETTPPATPLTPAEVIFACSGFSGPSVVKLVLSGWIRSGAWVYTATLLNGSGPGGQEVLMTEMLPYALSPSDKTYKGSDANATYELATSMSTYPYTGAINYSSPSLNLSANLNCFANF